MRRRDWRRACPGCTAVDRRRRPLDARSLWRPAVSAAEGRACDRRGSVRAPSRARRSEEPILGGAGRGRRARLQGADGRARSRAAPRECGGARRELLHAAGVGDGRRTRPHRGAPRRRALRVRGRGRGASARERLLVRGRLRLALAAPLAAHDLSLARDVHDVDEARGPCRSGLDRRSRSRCSPRAGNGR